MKEGMYSIDYQAAAGRGWGILVFDTGVIWGADLGLGMYDGEYKYNEQTGLIDATLKAQFDPQDMAASGVTELVTGVPIPPEGLKFAIAVSLPRDMDKPTEVIVDVMGQPAKVVFRKIRNAPDFR